MDMMRFLLILILVEIVSTQHPLKILSFASVQQGEKSISDIKFDLQCD